MADSIIRYFYESTGLARKAAKATVSKIIRTLYWWDLKKDVQFYIAICCVCKKYLCFSQTSIAGLVLIGVYGHENGFAIDIVGSKTHLQLTSLGNSCIFTIFDQSLRIAVALPQPDRMSHSINYAV